MKTFRPFNKECERLFERLVQHDKAYTNDIQLTRSLPRRYPDLFDKHSGFLEIYRGEKAGRSVVLPREGIKCIPIIEPDSKRIRCNSRKKFGVVRIF